MRVVRQSDEFTCITGRRADGGAVGPTDVPILMDQRSSIRGDGQWDRDDRVGRIRSRKNVDEALIPDNMSLLVTIAQSCKS